MSHKTDYVISERHRNSWQLWFHSDNRRVKWATNGWYEFEGNKNQHGWLRMWRDSSEFLWRSLSRSKSGGKQGYLQQWGYLCTFPQPLCLEYKNISVLRLRLCEKKFWLYNHFSPVMQDKYVSNRLLFEDSWFRHTSAALIDCVIIFTAAW